MNMRRTVITLEIVWTESEYDDPAVWAWHTLLDLSAGESATVVTSETDADDKEAFDHYDKPENREAAGPAQEFRVPGAGQAAEGDEIAMRPDNDNKEE